MALVKTQETLLTPHRQIFFDAEIFFLDIVKHFFLNRKIKGFFPAKIKKHLVRRKKNLRQE